VTEQRGDFASIDSAALPVVATAPENPSVAESELLIACATWERTPARTERVRSAIRDIVWDRWVPRARAHRLVPHVHRQLDLLDELVPDAVRDQLREETRAIAVRALRLAAQLSELATAFEAVSIPLIAYKGPALSLAAYGDIGVRASVDLDVVVAPGNIDRAREVLRALGYASRAGMTPAQEHALQRSFGHFVYARDDASAPLELHWRFASPHYPWTFAPTTVSARASRIEIGGAVVLVPSALDEIVLQAMHGTRHQWDQLEWHYSSRRHRRRRFLCCSSARCNSTRDVRSCWVRDSRTNCSARWSRTRCSPRWSRTRCSPRRQPMLRSCVTRTKSSRGSCAVRPRTQRARIGGTASN
jgi:hypothetical protein